MTLFKGSGWKNWYLKELENNWPRKIADISLTFFGSSKFPSRNAQLITESIYLGQYVGWGCPDHLSRELISGESGPSYKGNGGGGATPSPGSTTAHEWNVSQLKYYAYNNTISIPRFSFFVSKNPLMAAEVKHRWLKIATFFRHWILT